MSQKQLRDPDILGRPKEYTQEALGNTLSDTVSLSPEFTEAPFHNEAANKTILFQDPPLRTPLLFRGR